MPDKPTVGFDRYGDGATVPNGLNVVGSGESFPTIGTNDGDFFLRTDFTPNRLFQKSGNRWIKIGDDNKNTWAAANRLLTSFVNNDDQSTLADGETINSKTNLSQVVKPRTD